MLPYKNFKSYKNELVNDGFKQTDLFFRSIKSPAERDADFVSREADSTFIAGRYSKNNQWSKSHSLTFFPRLSTLFKKKSIEPLENVSFAN